MTAVLRLFWNICLLRDGPEFVPTLNWFLVSLVAAELASSVVLLGVLVPQYAFPLALNLALISLAVTASIAWFALYLRNHEARFPATLGAILGTGVLINTVTALVLGATSGVAHWGMGWVLTLWGVVVVGFILHRALDVKLWIGLSLSVVTWMVGLVVAAGLLGEALNVEA